jgi:hypothetical protein
MTSEMFPPAAIGSFTICETICFARRLCPSVAATSSSFDCDPFRVLKSPCERARWPAAHFNRFPSLVAKEALHEASDGPVKRFRVLIGSSEHHAPFEGGNDLKGPRFRIGSADPLG